VQSSKRDLHINFSKDGKKFAYTQLEDKGFANVTSQIILNENGIEKILTDGYGDIKPSFSPNGKKVAFFRGVVGGYGYLYTIGTDGKNLEEIIPTRITNSSWSPDGKEIAFTAEGVEEKPYILTEKDIKDLKEYYKTDNITYKVGDTIIIKEFYSAVAVVNLETKEHKFLTINNGNSESPEFTDNGKILYIYNKNKGTSNGKELWMMDRDGNNKKPLVTVENFSTKKINPDGSATYHLKTGEIDSVSADGNRIAYVLNTRERIVQYAPKKNNKLLYDTNEIKDEYKNGIYVMDLKTGTANLVIDEGNLWFPELKNNKVYFSRCDDERTEHDIYSVDLE